MGNRKAKCTFELSKWEDNDWNYKRNYQQQHTPRSSQTISYVVWLKIKRIDIQTQERLPFTFNGDDA